MKDSTRQGVSLQTKKEEKEAVTDVDEEKFWSAGLFDSGTAKQLLLRILFISIMVKCLACVVVNIERFV